ncbi:hypothetical protein ACFO5K_18505 [Nocardia halotolerans]|uniref:Uncharacterized protein n=1 Tax=Nocardia halotolerans TaxID=1755878 RepID=A0ABV8VLE3_9NOCA
MRYSDRLALETPDPVTEPDAPFVHWPEPSPLHSWWTEIMEGVAPHRTGTGRSRTGGQQSSRLPRS